LKTAITLFISLFLVGCSAVSSSPAEQDREIRLLMSFRPDVQFAPFYVAIERGYYADEGLDVRIEHMPENEAVALVGAGEAPFSIASGEQILLSRAQGLPAVYVMAWWQDYPVAVAFPEDSAIRSVSDLAGKQIGIPGLFGASYIGFRALIKVADLQETDLQLDSIEYTQVQSLLAGREDAVVVYANNEPIQLEAQGMPVRLFRVADYVQLASNGLITSEELIDAEPDLVRSMIKATLKGIEDTIEDPEKAFDISTEYVEGLAQADRSVLFQVLQRSTEFWTADRLGYSEPAAWENMHAILLEMGMLAEALDIERAFTNEFIP
jgi:NitT/TauT family transport system substrate-binding protein